MTDEWESSLNELLEDGPFHVKQDTIKGWWVMDNYGDGIARCQFEREATAIARALNLQLAPSAEGQRP